MISFFFYSFPILNLNASPAALVSRFSVRSVCACPFLGRRGNRWWVFQRRITHTFLYYLPRRPSIKSTTGWDANLRAAGTCLKVERRLGFIVSSLTCRPDKRASDCAAPRPGWLCSPPTHPPLLMAIYCFLSPENGTLRTTELQTVRSASFPRAGALRRPNTP